MEYWKRKTRDYHQKLNTRVASQIVEQFNTYDPRKVELLICLLEFSLI